MRERFGKDDGVSGTCFDGSDTVRQLLLGARFSPLLRQVERDLVTAANAPEPTIAWADIIELDPHSDKPTVEFAHRLLVVALATIRVTDGAVATSSEATTVAAPAAAVLWAEDGKVILHVAAVQHKRVSLPVCMTARAGAATHMVEAVAAAATHQLCQN
eukprot:COSAG06_NODE_21484_length_755_cov_1.160061_1_plen_158_part_10